MKKTLRRLLYGAIVVVMTAGLLAGTAAAYTTANFNDVPTNHWAYNDIMTLADVDAIRGVGGNRFNPDGTLTARDFLTLIGRTIYPGAVDESSSDIYWLPHYEVALKKGIVLEAELTTDGLAQPITRYEMARIMVRVDEKFSGNAAVETDTSKITDYAEVPEEYRYSVEQAYAKGLINGVGSGRFDGTSGMSRAQASVVIGRLQTAMNLQPLALTVTEVSLTYLSPYQEPIPRVTGMVGSITAVSSDTSVAVATIEISSSRTWVHIAARGTGTCTVTVTDEAGRSVTANVSVDYTPPEPPARTGEMATVTFLGEVTCYDDTKASSHSYPAGIKVEWLSEDGRLLGETETFEKQPDVYGRNNFKMQATIDAADFWGRQDTYYLRCTYIDADGNRFSNISATTRLPRKFELQTDSYFRVNSKDPYYLAGSGGKACMVLVQVSNREDRFLDF